MEELLSLLRILELLDSLFLQQQEIFFPCYFFLFTFDFADFLINNGLLLLELSQLFLEDFNTLSHILVARAEVIMQGLLVLHVSCVSFLILLLIPCFIPHLRQVLNLSLQQSHCSFNCLNLFFLSRIFNQNLFSLVQEYLPFIHQCHPLCPQLFNLRIVALDLNRVQSML